MSTSNEVTTFHQRLISDYVHYLIGGAVHYDVIDPPTSLENGGEMTVTIKVSDEALMQWARSAETLAA